MGRVTYISALNSPHLITDVDIAKRFIACFKEIPGTIKEKSAKLKASDKYIIRLNKQRNPQIKGSLIANFCEIYGYSPRYILTGKGTKKGEPDSSEVNKMFKQILSEVKNLDDKAIDIIHNLLSAVIELNVHFKNPKQELINQAKKHIKS